MIYQNTSPFSTSWRESVPNSTTIPNLSTYNSSSFSCFLHFVCMLVFFFVASQLSRDSSVSCEQLVWDFTSQCSLTVPSFWRCWLLVYLLAVIDIPMSGLKPPSACRYLCLKLNSIFFLSLTCSIETVHREIVRNALFDSDKCHTFFCPIASVFVFSSPPFKAITTNWLCLFFSRCRFPNEIVVQHV